MARHEIKVTLADIVQAARRMLRTAGRFVTIYAAERLSDLISQMRSDHIEPKLLRVIHSTWNTEAKLVLVEGIQDGRPGLKIAPPLVIYDAHGKYSQEVDRMFRP